MNRLIVIAKFKEDVSWVKDLTVDFVCYNKLNGSLPNVGREAHTYLHHIVQNYNILYDEMIFTQGNPFDHCDSFIDVANTDTLASEFVVFSKWIVDCDEFGAPNHRGLDIKSVWTKLFSIECPKTFRFGSGATLGVKKNRILFRSKEFYIKCLKMLEYATDPIEGYIFERLWPTIFDGKTI